MLARVPPSSFCFTVREVIWPLFHFFGMYMCAGFLGGSPLACFLGRVSFLSLLLVCSCGAGFLCCVLLPLFRDVPFSCSPLCLVCLLSWLCVVVLLSGFCPLFPSLPLGVWAVLTSGSAGPTPCCLRFGIGLLPQRPECLACWYCFLFSGAVTGWSRDGVCPVPFRHRAVWQQRLRPCLCGVLPSTPRCACRSCFLASPF